MERAVLAHPAILWLIKTDLIAADREYRTKVSPPNHKFAIAESQRYIINAANSRSTFDDGVEHRLHIRRGAADDPEHLGRCSLMFQRLAQLRVSFLDFFEEPHVLNGNDRLSRERLE